MLFDMLEFIIRSVDGGVYQSSFRCKQSGRNNRWQAGKLRESNKALSRIARRFGKFSLSDPHDYFLSISNTRMLPYVNTYSAMPAGGVSPVFEVQP